MEHKPDTSTRDLIVYFAIALLFALLSLPARKLVRVMINSNSAQITFDLSWIFWVCIALSVLSLLPLLGFILIWLRERHMVPTIVDRFFHDQSVLGFKHTSGKVRALASGVAGRLLLACVGILFVAGLLWRTGAIHNEETNNRLYQLVDQSMGRYPKTSELSTVSLNYFHQGRSGGFASGKDYFGNCLKLVGDLKERGVKAVLVGVPIFPDHAESVRLLRELENTGIVVFGAQVNLRFADSLGEFIFSKGVFTLSEHEVAESDHLNRIRPCGLTRGLTESPDITIELLRKLKGYGRDVPLNQDGNEIRFGDYRIPVTRDGWMYSRDKTSFLPLSDLVYVDSHGSWIPPDSLRFTLSDVRGAGLKRVGPWRAGSKPDMGHEIGDELKGKIVLLNQSFGQTSFFYPKAYAVALQNIITGNVLRKWEQGYLWLSFIGLALAGLVALFFRPLVSLSLIILLGMGSLLVGYYLYDAQNILVDIFYPLLSLAIAAVAFPVIAMGHRPTKGSVEAE